LKADGAGAKAEADATRAAAARAVNDTILVVVEFES